MQTETGHRRGNAPVLARRASYVAVGPRGVWMRNAGWHKTHAKDTGPLTARRMRCDDLDKIAQRKIIYDEPTVCIRKALDIGAAWGAP